MYRQSIAGKVSRCAYLALLGAFILFPLYYMVLLSLKAPADIFREPSLWPNGNLSMDNYVRVLEGGFIRNLVNSVVVAGGSTLAALGISVLAAYSVVRLRYAGRGAITKIVLFGYLTPSSLLFIPMAVIMADLQLVNTLHGLAIVYMSFATPLAMWLLMGFFRALPKELEEAALVDGATRLQALRYILIPLLKPGIFAVGMITFTMGFNEFLYALTLNLTPDTYTVPIAISRLITGDVFRWGDIMAASVIASLPVVLLYYFGQRYLSEGFAAGGVKG